MQKAAVFFFLLALAACGTQKKSGTFNESLFRATDLTDENLFSKNIEGPAFFHDTLYVVNYQHDGTIATVNPDGTCELFLQLPKGSTGNSIKFDPEGNMYIADFTGHNVLSVDSAHHISAYCHNDKFNQPNDICRSGRGWILASDPDWQHSTGQLWRIDAGGAPVLLANNMGTTNGIELSPDEKKLYVDESVQRKIWVFDIDTSGNISNKKLLTQFTDFGMDGMHCDKDGNIYVCRYGKGTIVELNPGGDLIREIPLKGKDCSNFVFGGEDGRTVFVTLQDRKCIEMFRTDVPGKSVPGCNW